MSKTVRTVVLLLLLGQPLVMAQQPPARAPGTVEATPRKSPPVQIGQTAPDFTLEDERGRKVQLAAMRGKMPVVLVFYRGWW